MHGTQSHNAIDCSVKSSHLESSHLPTLPTSRRSRRPDPLNVPPPSTFRRKQRKYATHDPEPPKLPIVLLATIRHSIASEIANFESACWSESPDELCEWDNEFRALEIGEVR